MKHEDIDHTGLTGISSGDVATDPIWDAAGDLAVGSGANTAAKLSLAQGKLARVGGALAYDSGTSFPGSPSSGDRYWRTDHGMEFYYDGTRWVSTVLHKLTPWTEVASSLSASGNPTRHMTQQTVGTDIWLVSCLTTYFVSSGGTSLGASHKWVGVTQKRDTSDAATTVITINIDSGSSATHRQDVQAIGALLGTFATYPLFTTSWTKTGSPGNLRAMTDIAYRLIAT